MPSRLLQLDRQSVRLDARIDRYDPRDRPYAPPVASLPPRWPDDGVLTRLLPAFAAQGLVLDQGMDGACTGYGLASVVNFLLWQRDGAAHRGVSPHMLYDLARFYDEWPGEDYAGSSCRGAVKGWSKHGSCAAPLWTRSVHDDGAADAGVDAGADADAGAGGDVASAPGARRASPAGYRPDSGWAADAARRPVGVYYRVDSSAITDMQAALYNIGALYVSARVHDGWTACLASLAPASAAASAAPASALVAPAQVGAHASLPVIAWDGLPGTAGNHAFAIVGYNEYGFIVLNSWGQAWGAGGFAVLRYDDWRAHGADAWVAALGVPQLAPAVTAPPVTAVTEVPASLAAALPAQAGEAIANCMRRIGNSLAGGDMPLPPRVSAPAGAARVAAPAAATIAGSMVAAAATAAMASATLRTAPWSTQVAYAHALVSGNNGVLRSSRPDIARSADLVNVAVLEDLGAWLDGPGRHSRKLVVYAHGGLNAEAAAIQRVRVMGPYFEANGIYPLFYTWRTGVLETLGGVLADALGPAPGPALAGRTLGDAVDGLLETVAHNVRWMWTEMKSNAAVAASSSAGTAGQDGALVLLVAALAQLRQRYPALEIHLAGHSAGAFVLGHLLDLCRTRAMAVASVTLYAPACPIDFAMRTFQAAVEAGTVPRERFWLHLLTDVQERDDTVGPYGKSLLYLVARGFEEVRKTPLAGLFRALDPAMSNPDDDLWQPLYWPQVQAWRAWVAALPAQADGTPACELSGARVMVSKQRAIKPGHSAFDNDIRVLSRSINRMLGRSPDAALAAPVTDLDY